MGKKKKAARFFSSSKAEPAAEPAPEKKPEPKPEVKTEQPPVAAAPEPAPVATIESKDSIVYDGNNAEECMAFCGVTRRSDMPARGLKLMPVKQPPQGSPIELRVGQRIVKQTYSCYRVED